MIVSFSVSNFRSFSAEETFSLVASNRLAGSHDDHAVPIPGSEHRVLRAAVLYGANGAGKSNLFKALSYVKDVALKSRGKGTGTGREAFRLGPNIGEPSTFDLQFVVAGKLYRFGFKADDERLTEEWLAEVDGEQERTIYERITDKSGNVTVEAPGLKGTEPKLEALVTVGGPPNQSFLATVSVTLGPLGHGKVLETVLAWLKEGLHLVDPNGAVRDVWPHLANDPTCIAFAGDFLKSVSTGVEGLNVNSREIDAEGLLRLISSQSATRLLNELSESENGRHFVGVKGGGELLLKRLDSNRARLVSIRSLHKDINGHVVPFELGDESDGTQRLLYLMPALQHLQTMDQVFVIDEIDRSLHPNLVWEFVDFFLKGAGERHAQLILTTHESSLLDLDLLRRDEIWFAEKDQGGATHLYPLTDFKVRNDSEIRKHYLNGRFGAVPFLGDLNRLLDDEKQAV